MIICLDLPFQERFERIQMRSNNLQVKENLFPYSWLLTEEQDFKVFKKGKQNYGRY